LQALSKNENKKSKERIIQAMQFVSKVTEQADQAAKEFA
jgi:hypothetical protein